MNCIHCGKPPFPNFVPVAIPARVTPGPHLLTVQAAARALALSDRTVRRLIWDGQIDCVRLNKQLRIAPEALEAYVARQQAAGVQVEPVSIVRPLAQQDGERKRPYNRVAR